MANIWYDNFSTDKSWTGYGGTAVWERGSPGQTPPGSAHDGSNVLATDLDADYAGNITTALYITSPTIDCSGYEDVTLSFRRHAHFENNTDYDTFTVDVYDGSNWQTVWTSDNTATDIEDASWTLQQPSISTYGDDNADFKIRYGIRTDANTAHRGWFIDAVSVDGDATTTYKLEGATKNAAGSALGACDCHLFKMNVAGDDADWVAFDESDGSGNYSFTGLTDNDARYFVVAWKDNTPHVFDCTDHVLTPVAE